MNGHAWILSAAGGLAVGNGAGLWWLPGILIGSVGVLALVGGFAIGGPDAVGGVVFGSVTLAAAAVILWRRSPERSD